MTGIKDFKIESWTVLQVREKIDNNLVMKDKFQRKKKWVTLPNGKQHSIQEYIDFLWKIQSSVHTITMGKSENGYSNVDGNNRLNAIMSYLEKPFVIYPQYLDDIRKFVNITYDNSAREEIMSIFEALSYDDIVNFTYSKYFNDIGKKDLYKQFLKNGRDEWDTFYTGENDTPGFRDNFMIKGITKFTDVKMYISLFEGYSSHELNDIYITLNSHGGGFTKNESLSGELYKTVDFSINDVNTRNNINTELIKLYDRQSEGEKLNCYEHNIDSAMNAFDFLTGFQMVIHNRCTFIDDVGNKGIGLFFKLYNLIYGNLDDTFTSENVNQFIEYIYKVTDVLQEVSCQLFPDMLDVVYRKGILNKLKSLKTNKMCLIIASVIGYYRKGVPSNNIVKSIELSLLYHLLVNDVADIAFRTTFRISDSLAHSAAGSFIDNMTMKMLKNPTLISQDITSEKMGGVIDMLLNQKIDNNPYEIRESGRVKKDKRRERTALESFMTLYYYRLKVPCEFLSKVFWMEHIVPFSSDWVGNIDIDRPGNVIPIIDTINRKRGTRHIDSYGSIESAMKINFMSFIDDIVPSREVYNSIVNHSSTRPNVTNTDNYNTLCSENETTYRNTFLGYLFPI